MFDNSHLMELKVQPTKCVTSDSEVLCANEKNDQTKY